jgi:addiction module HigA family antidote
MKIPQTPFSCDTHPGEFIREEFLQAGGKSIFEFAMEMQISEKDACEIIVGQKPITQNLAKSLERVFGIKSEYWIGMQLEWERKSKLQGDYANLV